MQKISKFIVGASVAAAVTAGVAYAANTGSLPLRAADGVEAVSATWAFAGPAEEVTGSATTQALVPSIKFGDGVKFADSKGNTTGVFGGETMSVLAFDMTNSGKNENYFVEFTVTPESDFTVGGFSIELLNSGWGDGRYDIAVIYDGVETDLVTNQTPLRNNSTDTSVAARTVSVSGNDIVVEAGKPLTYKLYYYSRNNNSNPRALLLHNAVISGTMAEGGDEPSVDENYFCIPGTLEFVNKDSHLSHNGTATEEKETDGVMYPNIGYWSDGASVTFNDVHVHKAGTYNVLLPTDNSYGDYDCLIEVKDAESGAVEASYSGNFLKNSSKWAKMEYELKGTVTEGMKNIVFTAVRPEGVTRGYAGNFRAPEFVWTGEGEVGGGDDPVVDVPEGWMSIPGELDIRKWTYNTEGHGRFGFETDEKGVGYVKNKAVANVDFFNKEEGVYNMQWRWNRSNGGDVRIVVKDLDTEAVEIDQTWTIANGISDIVLEGNMTAGKKNISLSMTANHDSWIGNYFSPVLTKIADTYAAVKAVSAEGADATSVDGYDYAFNLPLAYNAETVKFNVEYVGGTLTAKVGDTELTAEGTTYTIPAPAANEETIVDLALAAAEGAYCGQTDYKVRFFHIGDVLVGNVTVDGRAVDAAVVEALNADATAKLEGNVYTAMPAVKATFIDGTEATATVTVEGTVATAKFAGKAGEATKDFTLAIDGVHIYNRADSDLDAKVTFDAACKGDDGNWSNGLYTITNCNDGWGGTQFKMKGNGTHVLSVPGDMKVKQLILAQLFDNYADGKVKSVTSEGADVWMPTASEFKGDKGTAYNLVINVDNHKAGAPFTIEFEGGSQPVAWFEFVYEAVAPEGAPSMVKSSATSTEHLNHAVVSFSFDRAMADATITVNGTEVKAMGGTATLSFPVWDLPYSTDVEITIPAGAAADTYGNKTDKAYTHVLNVGARAEVAAMAADRFVVVSSVDELRAAVAALSETNKTADSDWTVIYLTNGDYDLGGECEEYVDANGNKTWRNADSDTPLLHINKLYNVALVGESQEGVLIHGMRAGISYPVLSTRYSTNVFMENLTIRNDLDFGRSSRRGVGVAQYGGNCDIMKNVTLQSIQDTQVTGERGYYLNCTFHGSVDYFCGGGDHYYDHCTIVHEIAGGYITAPSTSATLLHGYVFQGCTIKGEGKYDLGRPWQNEPRAFFLNTVMESLPNDGGWGKMGNLVTHFFEYNSMDKNGNALDLSKRTNSPTSLNTYSPILPAEYADYFTSRNVLGGKDSWEATDHTAECEAPVVTIDATGNLNWNKVEDAAGYLVYANGKYAGFTAEPGFSTADANRVAAAEDVVTPEYTVAAINTNGARGVISAPAKDQSGVEGVGVDAGIVSVEYYNMQGVRVDESYIGFAVRVTTYIDGTTVTEKVKL